MKKAETIQKMFSSIAPRYDRANSILSLGIHHLWRSQLVNMSVVKNAQRILDCATGTGDLALEFKKKAPQNCEVIGTDFCTDMMNSAPAKAKKANLEVKFEQADATKLQYEDNHFDIVSISFGIRNVDNVDAALKELHRVCKAGGEVFILEFGQPQNRALNSAYKFYSQQILPRIGGLITGNKKAYSYLNESAAEFPCGADFVALMKENGSYSSIKTTALSGGIAYIYHGVTG